MDNYTRLLIDSITDENENPFNSDTDAIAHIKQRFWNEYGFEVKRSGLRMTCEDWLRGLALDVPFYNEDCARFEGADVCDNDDNVTYDDFYDAVSRYWSKLTQALVGLIESEEVAA